MGERRAIHRCHRAVALSALALGAVLALAPAVHPETLRILTVDAATGAPLPARVSLRSAGGEWIGARDRNVEIRTSGSRDCAA